MYFDFIMLVTDADITQLLFLCEDITFLSTTFHSELQLNLIRICQNWTQTYFYILKHMYMYVYVLEKGRPFKINLNLLELVRCGFVTGHGEFYYYSKLSN